MKGPGLRIRHDVRRRWRCPETGRVLKTPGSVTHLYSPFVRHARWMKLEEEFSPPRQQVPLQELLERMVIEAPEEDPTPEVNQAKTETETSETAGNDDTSP